MSSVKVQLENMQLPDFITPPIIKIIDENSLLFIFEHDDLILVNELVLKESDQIPGFKQFYETKLFVVNRKLSSGKYTFSTTDVRGSEVKANTLDELIALIYV